MNASKYMRGSMLERIRDVRKHESGFTLIELLIVVIVLGILAAIVLFALGSFTKDSSTAACATDGKQAQTAETAYFAKTGGYTTNWDDLVPTYIQTQPSTKNYTVTLHSDGSVTGALKGGGACYPAA